MPSPSPRTAPAKGGLHGSAASPLLARSAIGPCPAGELACASSARVRARQSPSPATHIVLAWNDLGMHCMNQTHANLVGPAALQHAAGPGHPARRRDHAALLITQGVTLEYSFPGNTYSVGKTDFWTYAFDLFGVNLPPNIGLTGKGLTGTFDRRRRSLRRRGHPPDAVHGRGADGRGALPGGAGDPARPGWRRSWRGVPGGRRSRSR